VVKVVTTKEQIRACVAILHDGSGFSINRNTIAIKISVFPPPALTLKDLTPAMPLCRYAGMVLNGYPTKARGLVTQATDLA